MDFLPILSLVLEWVPWIVTGASAITAVTPTPKDDAILAGVLRFFRILALNVGKENPRA